jgi:hypothetical protein
VTPKHSLKGIRKETSPHPQSGTGQSAGKSDSRKFKKGLLWAAASAGTAVIALLVTGVFPAGLGQVLNAAKIKDAIRPGPDMIVSESLYDPDGNGVPRPFVVPGNYRPPSWVIQSLAEDGAGQDAWLYGQIYKAGGVAIQDVFTRIVLEGNRNEKVIILNIYPVNFHRARPLNGVLFDISGAQGEFSDIQMAFNMDQISPHALTVVHDDVIENQPFFESHSISLADGEVAVLDIQATTSCYSASFDLAVSYMVGDANRTEVITDHGKPFRVSAYRVTKTAQLSYNQDFEMGEDFSVTPQNPQAILTASQFSGCPYFATSKNGK